MPVIRRSMVWPLASAGAAVGAYLVVRAALRQPSQPYAAWGGSAVVTAGPRSSAAIDAALTEAASGEDVLMRRLRFLELVETADPSELRRLFLSRQTTRREKRAIAQRWAETDSASLMGFLKGLSRHEWDRDGEQYDAVRGILFRAWARQDPDAALAAAESLSRRPNFRGARWEIVQALLATDPAKAFEAAAGLPIWTLGDGLADSIWQDDPAAFLKAAGEAPSQALRNERIHQLVDNAFAAWVTQNPSAASEWLKSRPPEQQRRLWSRMAFRMANAEPAVAQAWFKDLPPSAEREAAGVEIVNAWARKEPQAALEWLQDNLEGGRTQAFAHVATALAEKGVDNAKKLLDAMPPGTQRDEVVAAIARTWSGKEFKPAMDWVLSLPADDPGRRRAMQQMGFQWPEKDLPAAAAYVQANAGRDEARSMLWRVTSRFADTDLGAGLAWAASLPKNAQESAYMQFWNAAYRRNTQPAIIAALEKLPPSQQGSVIERIVEGTLRGAPETPEEGGRYVGSLNLVPPSLRETARRAVESSTQGDAERKKAALEALK